MRTETLMFNQYLHRIGINSVVINTPKEAHLSCGLCAKFSLQDFPTVKRIGLMPYKSFVGFFKLTKTPLGLIVSPIK